jgi:hypothetical protein
MTEKDLINLDFTRVDHTKEEWGGDTDWYCYEYEVGDICLLTQANDEIKNDEWYVEIFDYQNIRFTSRTELEIFITLLVNNYREDDSI